MESKCSIFIMTIAKMGQVVSVPKTKAIDISDISVFLSDTFTVVRSDRSHDRGWSACDFFLEDGNRTDFDSIVGAKCEVRPGETPVWRILMHNQKDGIANRFGWRRLSTIWPTRLDGDEEAIQKWWTETEAKLDDLYYWHYHSS